MSALDDEGSLVRSLRARVEELARAAGAEPMLDDPLPSGDLDVLICQVGAEDVAIPLHQAQEVLLVAATTPLPDAPPWVVGLLDLRGEPLPILDVAARLDRRTSAPKVTDHVVICRDVGRRVGLLVSGVHGVMSLARASVPADLSVHAAPYVRAALRYEDRIALLISVRRLIASSQIPELPADTRATGPRSERA